MGHIITPSMERVVAAMKHHAQTGYFDGHTTNAYFDHAKCLHPETGTLLLFTRDVGYHSCGWFKNPDYERCYHLSLSFWDKENPRPFEPRLARVWCKAFFGDWARYIWEEGMWRKALSAAECRHYRVMCNPAWEPIIPRKEVYSREFTEKGWQSWSAQNYEKGEL